MSKLCFYVKLMIGRILQICIMQFCLQFKTHNTKKLSYFCFFSVLFLVVYLHWTRSLRGAIGQRVRLLTERLVVRAHPGAEKLFKAVFQLLSLQCFQHILPGKVVLKLIIAGNFSKNNYTLVYAVIAQLGERQTEDLKVPGSIPGRGIFFVVHQNINRHCATESLT